MSSADLINQLKAPFEPEDVKWRVQTAGVGGNGNPWAMIVPYITSRAIHKRLDEVFPLAWQNVHKETADGKGYLCGISVLIGDQWITRWDGAEFTGIEALKGALSGSMKRAGVLFGIGAYLYQMDKTIWAECKPCQSQRDAVNNFQMIAPKSGPKVGMDWKPPQLPTWAMPHKDYSPFTRAMADAETMADLQEAYKEAVLAARAANNTALGKQFTEAKDKRKAQLESDLALDMDSQRGAITNWLQGQIISLASAPNPSALNGLSKAIQSDLERRCMGQVFDTDQLKNQLAKAVYERKQQLEAKV